MLNISKLLFLSIMILSTSLTLSSESWLGMWMGLEMNLIAFIPMMFKSKNPNSSESCMIYFLIQSLGSILMLISVINNSLVMFNPSLTEELLITTLMFSMMIKLGVPPFHFWFPEILNKINWTNCIILMTWQKIAPLFILSLVINNTLLPIIICLTTMIGAMGGLNQTSIRKIMAFSSINHLGWMIACMKFNNNLWMKYLLIYSIIVMMMIYTFWFYSSYYMNQLSSLNIKFTEKFSIIILFLSLGGLPPFLGFLPKWLVIQPLIMSNSISIMIIMILSTLVTLFYYLRLTSTILLISETTPKWYYKKPMNQNMLSMMIMINLILPVIATFSL